MQIGTAPTTTNVVAVQNDTADISDIRNPTKKKRRLNVSYEQLRENATTTFNNSLAVGTRKHYASVYNSLLDFYDANNETKQLLLYDNTQQRKLDFSELKAQHVVSYFESMQMLDLNGVWVRDWMSNIKKKRSAIKHYRTIYERENTICSTYTYMYNSKIYEDEMKRWVKGAESAEAELRKAGRLPALKGKFELTEELYDYFCCETFKMPAYAHLFNVFMWQSCGRSDNIGTTNFSHFGVGSDSIFVMFPKSKTNGQGGADRNHKMSFYSNPYNYKVDFFFSLGIYLLEMKDYPSGLLFPGGVSTGKAFIKLLRSKITNETLIQLVSYNWDFYSNHSWRKGILTWLINDTLSPPSQISVSIRAGHLPEGMNDTYYKFGKNGDGKVGQLLSNKQFMQLGTTCPYFVDINDPYVVTAVRTLFPWSIDSTPVMRLAVLPRVLASVVHHLTAENGFVNDYPDHNVVLHSDIMDGDVLAQLKSRLGDIENGENGPKITGVSDEYKMKKKTYENTTPEAQRRNIHAELQEAGVNMQVTPADLTRTQALIMEQIASLRQEVCSQDVTLTQRTTAAPFGAVADGTEFLHSDGNNYKVPDNFRLPGVGVQFGWKYWWCGFSSKTLGTKIQRQIVLPWQVQPIRNISATDIPKSNKILKNSRKRCSEWRTVYMYIEVKLDEIAVSESSNLPIEWKDNPYSWRVCRHVSNVIDTIVSEYKKLVLTATSAGANKVSTFSKMITKVKKGSAN
jgi:hypothetical protein